MITDLGDAEEAGIARAIERDDVARLERDPARWQGELRPLAGRPGLEQPALGDLGCLIGLHDDGKLGKRDAAAGPDEATGLCNSTAVVALGGRIGNPRRGGPSGFPPTAQGQ
mgnify:CR=1 FL=1